MYLKDLRSKHIILTRNFFSQHSVFKMRVLQIAVACIIFFKGLLATTPPASSPSIIIIGTGPSGIAAATRLLKNNFAHLTILEAEDRIGGRIHSVHFGDAYADLGAEFYDGQESNVVFKMVKDLNLLKPSHTNVEFYQSNGEQIEQQTAEKLFAFVATASNKSAKGCEQLKSVGECLNIQIKPLINSAQNAKEKEVFSGASDWATTLLAIPRSPLNLNDLQLTTEFPQTSGDLLNWNGLGYKTILEVMMQKYPNKANQLPIDDKIFLQKIVSNITGWREGDKVTVTTTDGSVYEADHVIFTPSVGVLKAQHEHIFNPPLPSEKIDAINNIGFGAAFKVLLHFQEKWWKGDADWEFIWTPQDKEELKHKNLEWLLDLPGLKQAPNNPNVLSGFHAGSHIPLIENLPEDKFLEGQKYVIKKFLGSRYNVTMPDKILRTKWFSNPNFQGACSYESVKGHSAGGNGFQQKLASPLKNSNDKFTVLFAGEASNPYHFGTVHGAIESGYREADRLIQLYQV